MRRILVIGCPGSGNSRLSEILGEKLGLPVVHLDQLWWKPGWQNVSVEEFDEQLDTVLEREKWIIDGNFSRTMPLRLRYCDTIIYLDYSRWECLLGMTQRVLDSYGKVRPDMAEGCPERFDWEFVKYIWNFNRDNRVRNSTWIAQAKHAKAIVLKNRKEARAFLESI